MLSAQERCGWEGRRLWHEGLRGPWGFCGLLLEPHRGPSLPSLSRMALAEVPGFPRCFRPFRVVVLKRAFSGVPCFWWVLGLWFPTLAAGCFFFLICCTSLQGKHNETDPVGGGFYFLSVFTQRTHLEHAEMGKNIKVSPKL